MSEQIAEVYIDIKQAAQILNNVSIRTAYRYIDKGSVGLTIATTTGVENNTVKKLYRQDDIIALSRALNKDRTILVKVPVNVRPAAIETNGIAMPEERLTQPLNDVAVVPFKSVVMLIVSTQLIVLLILITALLFLTQSVNSLKNNIDGIRQEYRDSRLIEGVENEAANEIRSRV